MKLGIKLAGLAIAVAVSGNVMASPLEIDYANITGSYISFNNNSTFDFTPTTTNNLRVTGSGDFGAITGTYTVGAVTSTPVPGPNGPISTAPVTGTGGLVIHSSSGDLTATVTFVDIEQFGTGSTINTGGVVDLTNVHYTGNEADLMALAATGSGINVITFQFATIESLSTLKTQGGQTSFSGSITEPVPDGGTTVALLGGAMLVIGGIRRKING